MGIAVAMAGESVPLLHMVLADYTSVGSTPKVTMLDGGEFTSVRGGTLARTIKSRKLRGRL